MPIVIMQSIMKISSVGPMQAPQENDLDRSFEIDLADLGSPVDSPVAAPENETDAGEDHDSREGLMHLVDFLQRKREEKREKTSLKLGLGKSAQAIRAYERQIESTDSEDPVGQNFKRKS